jgi:diguanylate cyclase (GGDEF)-like protein
VLIALDPVIRRCPATRSQAGRPRADHPRVSARDHTGGEGKYSLADTMSPLWSGDTASAMDEGASWLCPSELDRRRLLEMELRLLRPRLISYACTILALFAVLPRSGPWILALPVVSLVNYKLATKRIAGRTRPEYLIAYSASVTQLMVGVGIAMSGGPQSPLMALLVVPFVSFAARFTTRGTIAGVALTAGILLAATAGVDPHGLWHDPSLVLGTLASFVGVAAFGVALMNAEVEVRQDATLDPLTGLSNRKALRMRFDELHRQAELAGSAIGVVVLDIDHFKAVNDTYGHERGDAVLQAVAFELRNALREGELVYRLGGEEFVILLRGDEALASEPIAERLREAIAAARPTGLALTASLGVSVATDGVEYATLFAQADAALYEAKRLGRNRVVRHDPGRAAAPPHARIPAPAGWAEAPASTPATP